ncbi:ABC transporter permease [Holdemanella porci]|uniref:ABC transporter permease n=1 Tax=Holdemanella porci TaxID=2652276 RepID=UPI0022E8823F|nr:ABC transporter permease [Holdemanella porci]
MYIFKNAIRNVFRSKGRSILIGIILFVLMFSACIGLSIHQASITSQNASLELTNITGQISQNRMNMMKDFEPGNKEDMKEKMDSIESLSLDELQKYADSDYVSKFYYSASLSLQASDSFSLMENQQQGPGPMGQENSSSITVTGYENDEAMTDFTDGTSTITERNMFDEQTEENQCIIPEDLATYNGVSVGDTITLKVDDSTTVNFVVTGFYSSTSSNPMNASNTIYTSYNVVNNLSETYDLDLNVNGTYVFNTVKDFNKFKKECTKKGLSDSYTVTSSDLQSYQQSIVPLQNLSKFATYFLIVVFVIGAIVLVVLNIFSIRERKQEIGILCALGMNKTKIALQFFSETLFIALFAFIVGSGLGAVTSVPITNTLLESQISSTDSMNETKKQNFSRQQTPPNNDSSQQPKTDESNNQPQEKGLEKVTTVFEAMNFNVLLEVGAIAFVLVIISNCAALLCVMRYDPSSILSNRD